MTPLLINRDIRNSGIAMHKLAVGIIILSISIGNCSAQKIAFAVTGGVGYLERFSVGAAVLRNNSSSWSLTYGSKFFYKTQTFSSYFVTYARVFPYEFGGVRPGLGIKAGHTRFEDDYYRWKVISLVPIVEFQKNFSESTTVGVHAGIAMSKIQSVVRVDYGEIGKYRRYLPELEIYARYKLLRFGD
jgi:hypothetical protein